VGALVFGGERVCIQPGRTAGDVSLIAIAGVAGGVVPGTVVGHRAFDRGPGPAASALWSPRWEMAYV